MEPRFGHDFSQVRVHTDERASVSAEAVSARAFTVGSHVVFGKDQYAPHTERGNHLLAHELAHVIQQFHLPESQSQYRLWRQPTDGTPAEGSPETNDDGRVEVCQLYVYPPDAIYTHCNEGSEEGASSICALKACCPAPEFHSAWASKDFTVAYKNSTCDGEMLGEPKANVDEKDGLAWCNIFYKEVGGEMVPVFGTTIICKSELPIV
jgi:hypothetical protein